MTLLLLSLFITTPAIAEVQTDCSELYGVLLDAVEEGLLTYKEANEIYNRCAGPPDISL